MPTTGRILLEFLLDPASEPEPWTSLLELLDSEHVSLLDEPEGDPPYVLRLVPPADGDAAPLLDRLRAADGVGRVEEEVMRGLQ
jgi:hypothetical protein